MGLPLNDLDSDALLLLYVNGELANGEKAALERRLASEGALAAELERVRAAQALCAGAIAAVDATQKMPIGEGVAVRRVSRAMQQWQVDRIRATPPAQKTGLPLPWWSYPVAVAASLIVAFLVWSSRQTVNSIAADTTSVNSGGDGDQNGGGSVGDEIALSASPDMDWLAGSFGVSGAETSAGAADETPVAPTAVDDPAASIFPTHEEALQ